MVRFIWEYIIQWLTGDEGNTWYVGPENKMLHEAANWGQPFVWRSNISYIALTTSQLLLCSAFISLR